MALAGECPVCVAAMNLWVDIYGSEAGNLVVRTVARGGLYVAGGIAVKILPLLKDGRFLAATAAQGKDDGVPRAGARFAWCSTKSAPLKGAAYVAWKAL